MQGQNAAPPPPAPPQPGSIPWRETARQSLQARMDELQGEIQQEEDRIRQETDDNRFAFYPPNSRFYWLTVLAYLLSQVGLGLIGWLYFSGATKVFGMPVRLGILIPVLQLIHLGLSFKSVQLDELAGFLAFSRPMYLPNAGWYIVPFGIMIVIRVSRNYRDERFPGPPDKIWRISDKQQNERPGGDTPPEGFFRPIFVTTGEPRLTQEERESRAKGESFNPLDLQLNIEIAYFLRYRGEQRYGGIFRIARNLSARSGDLDARIQDLTREQSERDIKVVISRLTPATIIENLDLVNEVFLLMTKLALMRLAIDVTSAGLDDVNPSHETNDAQANVARAMFTKLKTITDAEATKQKDILEGQGEASKVQSRLEALAAGYKKIMDETKLGGDAVIGSETAKAALNDKTVVLGTEGVAQIFGLAEVGRRVFSSGGAQQPNPPTQS